MTSSLAWTRHHLLVAFALYCRLPFGRLHRENPEIVRIAEALGRTPSSLAMKLTNIASLDPAITSTGRAGLRSTSAADRAMWAEMESDSANFALECQAALMEVEGQTAAMIDAAEGSDMNRVGEDRIVQATLRIGQSFFRSAVLSAYNGRCCITGLSVPALLVASHIVPWRLNKLHRLDPRNGLALSALHDRAFDVGLITIDEDMTVQVSPNLTAQGDEFFTNAIEYYGGQPIRLPHKFGVGEEYLAFHREHVFQK
jgi:hypothetical protein